MTCRGIVIADFENNKMYSLQGIQWRVGDATGKEKRRAALLRCGNLGGNGHHASGDGKVHPEIF